MMRVRAAAAVATAVLVVAWPVAAPAQEQPPTAQLHDAREHLDEATAEEAALLVEYEATTTRLAQVRAEAARLDQDLRTATAEAAAAEARLAELTAQIDASRDRLGRLTRSLRRAELRLYAKAIDAYTSGGQQAQLVMSMLASTSIAQFGQRSAYADAVLDDQQDAIDDVVVLKDATSETVARLGHATAEASLARDDVRARQASIAAARTALVPVEAEVEALAAQQGSVLAQVELRRADYERRVAALEAESARITELLRRRAEEERRQATTTTTAPSPTTTLPGSGTTTTRPTSSGRLDVDPLDRMVITSGYGWRMHPVYGEMRFHAGIDLDADLGDPVYATKAGEVLTAGSCSGYGTCVLIDHGGGLATLYAHLSGLETSVGRDVGPGETIGRAGSTGISTGVHLHFEVRVNGNPVDPVPYLP
jgi:murein DD-endopeptidase MepM/ murein hydrolase activator NlpD